MVGGVRENDAVCTGNKLVRIGHPAEVQSKIDSGERVVKNGGGREKKVDSSFMPDDP